MMYGRSGSKKFRNLSKIELFQTDSYDDTDSCFA